MFPPQRGSNGEREAHKHTRKHTLNRNFVHQRIRRKKKKHKYNDSSATCLNQRQENKWPVTFSAKQQQKNHTIMGPTLPDIFAILMRYSGRVNKTPLFCLLVSQTTSLMSDPCCDPARRQRTIPQGCTAVELSDVLI